jgi:hypothetical protein
MQITYTAAEKINRTNYIRFLPIQYPRIIKQTPASARFKLFGDNTSSNYKDTSPADGIDDNRHKRLMDLSLQFSPIMIQNTFAVPMDFKKFMNLQSSFPLIVDTWDISKENAELKNTETINWPELGEPCLKREFEKDDCKLLKLLDKFDPYNPELVSFRNRVQDYNYKDFRVMYLDFPGRTEKEWREEYENKFTKSLKTKYKDFIKTYSHPFIREIKKPFSNISEYEFVLQFWLFYPFNDGGNNHLGDWEHINVIVSPVSKITENLNEKDINNILSGTNESGHLVIKRIEYYFHYKLMVVDFSSPNVYLPRDEWEKQIDKIQKTKLGRKKIIRSIRDLAYENEDETKYNTHPIAYIGADAKGISQLIKMPGPTNRDSHGCYPFIGIYKNVGPQGTAELISKSFDHKKYFEENSKPDTKKVYKRGSIIELNDTEKIELVPDWENIYESIKENPEIRRDWFWLLLPIRWGFPAVASPGAGLFENTDMGNLAPVTPSYTQGWNQTGTSSRYKDYDPQRLSSYAPQALVDSYVNTLGFLNFFVIVAYIPPVDLIWGLVGKSFIDFFKQSRPIYFPTNKVPYRFGGLSTGISRMFMDDDFTYLFLNEDQLPEIISRKEEIDPPGVQSDQETKIIINDPYFPVFRISTYYKTRTVVENSFWTFKTDLGLDVPLVNRSDPLRIRAKLDFNEFSGTFRYDITPKALKLYLKTGYSISWYRLIDTKVDGVLLTNSKTDYITKLGWTIGGGLEFQLIKSFSGIDISLGIEYLAFFHNLGLELEEIIDAPFNIQIKDEGIQRSSIIAYLTISY